MEPVVPKEAPPPPPQSLSSTEEEGMLSVTAAMARDAAVLFQSRRYTECAEVLAQLLQGGRPQGKALFFGRRCRKRHSKKDKHKHEKESVIVSVRESAESVTGNQSKSQKEWWRVTVKLEVRVTAAWRTIEVSGIVVDTSLRHHPKFQAGVADESHSITIGGSINIYLTHKNETLCVGSISKAQPRAQLWLILSEEMKLFHNSEKKAVYFNGYEFNHMYGSLLPLKTNKKLW